MFHWFRQTVKGNARLKRLALWAAHVASPLSDLVKLSAISRYAKFVREWRKFRHTGGEASVLDWYPCLNDCIPTTQIDTHYFYQAIWAFKKIAAANPKDHVDVGSDVRYVGMLTAITNVTFVDIRPLELNLERYEGKRGSVLALPYDDHSIVSLSCLSVAEHVGLGRYGDSIDPGGTVKACRELTRVLAKGGSLYFGLPIGKRRVCFNAHRIVQPDDVLEFFKDLQLEEFSAVDDAGHFVLHANMNDFMASEFANGLYHFRK